jgi:choline dehydrogenase-like flavoprotein
MRALSGAHFTHGKSRSALFEGVWIGDGSAFPTAPGVNPMISIMSLAHRTAANMVADS